MRCTWALHQKIAITRNPSGALGGAILCLSDDDWLDVPPFLPEDAVDSGRAPEYPGTKETKGLRLTGGGP
jgi:hypothetical protein